MFILALTCTLFCSYIKWSQQRHYVNEIKQTMMLQHYSIHDLMQNEDLMEKAHEDGVVGLGVEVTNIQFIESHDYY